MKTIFAAVAAIGLFATSSTAQDIDLPKQLSWTAYDTGSAGYNQAVAIGAALQTAAGINLRVLPGKTTCPAPNHCVRAGFSFRRPVSVAASWHRKAYLILELITGDHSQSGS